MCTFFEVEKVNKYKKKQFKMRDNRQEGQTIENATIAL